MSLLLGLFTLIATLLTVAVSATVFPLRASDPAGNGLAQAFLAISAVALWTVLAIVLVLTALRKQRYQLPWASINLYSLLLFALAAAGQLACLVQLTDRNAGGWFRLVLQLTVVASPALVLTHVAWRAFGAPLPMRFATLGIGTVVAVLSLVSLAGLLRPRATASPPTVNSLAFPALLIRGESKIEVVERPADLTSMNSNYVVNRSSNPLAVDSQFDIFVSTEHAEHPARPADAVRGDTGRVKANRGISAGLDRGQHAAVAMRVAGAQIGPPAVRQRRARTAHAPGSGGATAELDDGQASASCHYSARDIARPPPAPFT